MMVDSIVSVLTTLALILDVVNIVMWVSLIIAIRRRYK